ncbi:MAG: type II secretion system protein M [bacterium]|nr:type II secretion system protein M [bacterium]
MTLLAKFNKLNKRERYAIMVGVGVAVVFLVFQFIVEPLFSRADQKKKTLQTKAVMLQQMRQWQVEYDALTQTAKVSKSHFSNRKKGFTLYSFLQQLAGTAGVKNRITYMKPTKKVQKNSSYKLSRVEMKLDAITLEQLTTYLYKVETSKNMVEIKKLVISKKDKKQALITAVLQVETFEI